jgi:hypothetical protein
MTCAVTRNDQEDVTDREDVADQEDVADRKQVADQEDVADQKYAVDIRMLEIETEITFFREKIKIAFY